MNTQLIMGLGMEAQAGWIRSSLRRQSLHLHLPERHKAMGSFGGITHAPMKAMSELLLGSAHLGLMTMPPAGTLSC